MCYNKKLQIHKCTYKIKLICSLKNKTLQIFEDQYKELNERLSEWLTFYMPLFGILKRKIQQKNHFLLSDYVDSSFFSVTFEHSIWHFCLYNKYWKTTGDDNFEQQTWSGHIEMLTIMSDRSERIQIFCFDLVKLIYFKYLYFCYLQLVNSLTHFSGEYYLFIVYHVLWIKMILHLDKRGLVPW